MEKKIKYTKEAIEYLAKLSQGGMRDALTMLDKCLAYSDELTVENVTKALGIANYDYLIRLLDARIGNDVEGLLQIVNDVYMSGYDLKQFIKSFIYFVLDFNKYQLGEVEYLNCPLTEDIKHLFDKYVEVDARDILSHLIKLQADIKWDTNPKARIEAWCFIGE